MVKRRSLLKSALLLPIFPECLARVAYAQEKSPEGTLPPTKKATDIPVVTGLGRQADVTAHFFYQKLMQTSPGRILTLNDISPDEYFDLIDQVALAIIQTAMNHISGQSVLMLAQKIKLSTDNVIKNYQENISADAAERLYAHAISDWARTHICYDKRLLVSLSEPDHAKMLRETHDPTSLLRMMKPGTLCGGFALLCRELYRSKVFNITAVPRSIGRTLMASTE